MIAVLVLSTSIVQYTTTSDKKKCFMYEVINASLDSLARTLCQHFHRRPLVVADVVAVLVCDTN